MTILAYPANGTVCANLTIAAADAMADTATLTINGPASTTKLTMNASDAIFRLFIDGVQQAEGTYGATGASGVDYQVDWLTGSGILTVVGNPKAYWDLNGTDPDSGGSAPAGTWDASNTYWNTDATGGAGGTVGAWTPGQTAVFAAGTDASDAYTVTVSGTQQIGGLKVARGNVTLSGDGLQMTSDSMVRVVSGASATIASDISDDGSARGFTKGGDGTLVLGGSNTYTGATRVEGGTLSVSSLANAGAASNIGQYATAGAGGLVLAGGTFQYTGGTTTVDRGTTFAGDATIDVSTPGAALTLGNCDSVDVTKTLTVTGGAGSRLSIGELRIVEAANIALNPTTASMTVASVLGYTSYPLPGSIITLGGTSTGNVITGNLTRQNPPGSPYTRNMKLVKEGTGSWTILGNINAGDTVTINDGTLTLAGTNGYNTNTTVNGGTLEVTGSISNSNVTVNTGGTITGGGGTKNLTINGGGTFTWGYGDDGDYTLDAAALTLNDIWVLKLVDLGNDPQADQEYDLFTFTGNYNGEAVTGAIGLVEGSNYVFDTTDAPDWNVGGSQVVVDYADTGYRVFITGISAGLTGDINGDGVVDAADYILMKQNWGNAAGSSADAAASDLDGSGTVGIGDLDMLATAPNNAAAGAVTPEPATLALLAFGGLAVIRKGPRS